VSRVKPTAHDAFLSVGLLEYGKNDFIRLSENLGRYRFENKFGSLK